AYSGKIIQKSVCARAVSALQKLGLQVTFGKNWKECDIMETSSVYSRIADLHEAFEDHTIQLVHSTIGGLSSNQLLQHINWRIIKDNPKIFLGYSDNTVLQNAVLEKTGLVTYSGPNFNTLAWNNSYMLHFFKNCLWRTQSYEIKPSSYWYEGDLWWPNKLQEHKNKGLFMISEGSAEGRIIGGNLSSLHLLQGTEFMPSLKKSILFLEETATVEAQSTLGVFDRMLQSLIQTRAFKGVQGIVLGRFATKAGITDAQLKHMIHSKPELNNMPVIANCDFGHTYPQFTFPIGGTAQIISDTQGKQAILKILEH
ncbi:MAG: LD-carboxypeptidase, partial [Candidatus Woesearchaeota archaeon]|nr:LD-carboxypeptidase [Candidatus Woesearchaeota archaeon]